MLATSLKSITISIVQYTLCVCMLIAILLVQTGNQRRGVDRGAEVSACAGDIADAHPHAGRLQEAQEHPGEEEACIRAGWNQAKGRR